MDEDDDKKHFSLDKLIEDSSGKKKKKKKRLDKEKKRKEEDEFQVISCRCFVKSAQSLAQSDVHLTGSGGCGFDPCQVRRHSFVEIDNEIFFFTVTLLSTIFFCGD